MPYLLIGVVPRCMPLRDGHGRATADAADLSCLSTFGVATATDDDSTMCLSGEVVPPLGREVRTGSAYPLCVKRARNAEAQQQHSTNSTSASALSPGAVSPVARSCVEVADMGT